MTTNRASSTPPIIPASLQKRVALRTGLQSSPVSVPWRRRKRRACSFARNPVSQETLKKILDGAQETDELKNAYRELLRAQSLID
jgi:hypothetical protein